MRPVSLADNFAHAVFDNWTRHPSEVFHRVGVISIAVLRARLLGGTL
jgi:hypothetical protein